MFFKEDLVFASGGRSNFRIPSIVADKNGVIYAFCNDRKGDLRDEAAEVTLVFARKKPGQEWEAVRELEGIPDWAISMGSAVYDEMTDTVMCSGWRIANQKYEFRAYTEEELAESKRREEELGIESGQFLLYSTDQGETWQERPLNIEPILFTHWDGTVVKMDGYPHGGEHGIQLKNGIHKGRLLCPSRKEVKDFNSWDELRKCGYNNAIYSDDHGVTWKTSTPVQVGTGEGCLIENRDGTITYNSRAFFQDQKRYLATSIDGGATFGDFRTDDFLLEEIDQGCNASFLRVEREDIKDIAFLPEDADGITLFGNPRSETRDHMTICISYDGGKNWKKTKSIYEGPCAYSSLTFSIPEQCFYLLYEKGEFSEYDQGIAVASFDFEWLMA